MGIKFRGKRISSSSKEINQKIFQNAELPQGEGGDNFEQQVWRVQRDGVSFDLDDVRLKNQRYRNYSNHLGVIYLAVIVLINILI